MKTEKGTIQYFMEKNFPDNFASGKWGCVKIPNGEGKIAEHGCMVGVGVEKDKKTWYWVWLDYD